MIVIHYFVRCNGFGSVPCGVVAAMSPGSSVDEAREIAAKAGWTTAKDGIDRCPSCTEAVRSETVGAPAEGPPWAQ